MEAIIFETVNPRFCRQNDAFDGSCGFWYESYRIAVERRAIYHTAVRYITSTNDLIGRARSWHYCAQRPESVL
jgi:hypothetical protein